MLQSDTDGDGSLDREEFKKFFMESMEKKDSALNKILRDLHDFQELNEHAKGLPEDQRKVLNDMTHHMKNCFTKADSSGDGKVSKTELKKYMSDKGVQAFIGKKVNHGKVDETRKAFDDMFDMIDIDGSGRIELHEFQTYFLKMTKKNKATLEHFQAVLKYKK